MHRLLTALLALTAPAAAQNVLIVDPADPAAFATVQAAVDASQAGDTVAVRPGDYGAVAISNRSVALIGLRAPDGAPPRLDSLLVEHVPTPGQVVVRTFDVEWTGTDALDIRSAGGGVFLEAVECEVLRVIDSSTIAVLDTTVQRGAVLTGSQVDLFGCSIAGDPLQMVFGLGDGAGLKLDASQAHLSGCHVEGAQGPSSQFQAGPGAAALSLVNGSTATIIDTVTVGGPGGWSMGQQAPNGPPVTGTGAVWLPNSSAATHDITTSSPVRTGTLDVALVGGPFEDVLLFVSAGQAAFYLPTWNGPLLVDPSGGFFFLAGQLSAAGQLNASFNIVQPPVPAVRFSVQPFFVDTTGLGTDHVGGLRFVDLIDQSVVLVDCDGNQVDDTVELELGTAADCDGDGLLDACEIADGTEQDCNGNGIPDACDIANGTSLDANGDGIPDEC